MISIIIPCYNAENYLSDALDSLLAQTYSDFEAVCINDGSTDSTEQILQEYVAKDSRIQYWNNAQNSGVIATLNHGIQRAKGDFIARLDADDTCMPERLELQLKFLQQHPEVVVVASNYTIMNGEGKIIGKRISEVYFPEELLFKSFFVNPIGHGTIMARAEIYKEFPYHTMSWVWHSEDYELWTRILSKYQIAILPESLYVYRLYENSTSSKYETLQMQNHVSVSKQHILNVLKMDIDPHILALMCNRATYFQYTWKELRKCLDLFDRITNTYKKRIQSIEIKGVISLYFRIHSLDILFQVFKRQNKTLTRLYAAYCILANTIKSPLTTAQWFKSKF